MNMYKSRWFVAYLCVTFFSLHSFAQDVEEVVITGSYLKGSPTDGASPVEVVDRETIEDIGATSIADITRNLSVNSGSENNSDSFTQGATQGTSNVNLRDDFIFFPMWFQPSATTYPFAGKYIDYIECLKFLSKSLPKNWKIFVKESPDIFNMNKHAWFKGTYTRSKNFYTKLKKIKGVELVNYDIPDYKLIDNCKATASHADKFGLISILRNKPNINFSNSIQRYCHGTFVFKNKKDLKLSIAKIQNGFDIDNKKLSIFFSILSKKLFYRETIKGFNKYESKTEFKKISKLLGNELNKII